MLLKKSGGSDARDPFVFYHEGKFFHCFSQGPGCLWVACATKAEDLLLAQPVCVYRAEPGKPYSCELWAPELHVIDGKCYIYVACDDGNNYNHRMYVLTNHCADPQQPYCMVGKLSDDTDKWAIDATVFRYRGQLYTVWSGWQGDENVCQNLYIAKMSDPTTIASERVQISTPEYDWEKMDCKGGDNQPYINEGPAAYEKDGKLMLLYSASGSWANHYCIGLLELIGENPMDPTHWKKYPTPSLSQEEGWNGPGHCSVTSDGERDLIAFHVFNDGETHGWQRVHAVILPFEIREGKIFLD